MNRDSDSKFRIDFIDPLFAVAIHIGFVEGLLHEAWWRKQSFPTYINEYANLAMFAAGLCILVLSWIGYHRSISTKPIDSDQRFALDIVLLLLYIFLLLYFRSPAYVAILLFAVYVAYAFWDFYKTKEHLQKFYGNRTMPSASQYLVLCWRGWYRPKLHNKLKGEIVTLGWTGFYLLWIPFAFLPESETDFGKLFSSAVIVATALAYRTDKTRLRPLISSKLGKLIMIGMFVGAVWFHASWLASIATLFR
jgi:hypothetical protein